MEHKLLVPVRTTAAGALVLRVGRLPSGERTGLAFTREDKLAQVLGPSQKWTDMSWEALLDLLEPLGIEQVRVDPEHGDQPEGDTLLPPGRLEPGHQSSAARLAALRGPASSVGPYPESGRPPHPTWPAVRH